MHFKNSLISSLIIAAIWSCSSGDDPAPMEPANKPPQNFTLVLPVNNSTAVNLLPALSWEAANDPDGDPVRYDVYLNNGSGNPNSIIGSNVQSTNFTVTNSLEISTLYSWRVVAKDNQGATTNSVTFSFTTVGNMPPNAFNLLIPEDNATAVDLFPELSWEEAIDPEGDNITYDLYFDEGDVDPTTELAADLTTTNFSITERLSHNTTYSWKVIATDQSGASTESDTFSFTARPFRETLATSNAAFSDRSEQGLINFNNKLWIVGGKSFEAGTVYMNDVWSSTNGISWTEEVPNESPNSFTPRLDNTTVVFQDKIWVIGGEGPGGAERTDVWSSPDGITWTQETPDTGFTARKSHTSVVFNNKIWVMGGTDGNIRFDDVWSSSDGVNWVEENASAPFLERAGHTSAVFLDKIWVIGGFVTGGGEKNDVWSSTDGVNWVEEISNAAFSPRSAPASIAFEERLWVICGRTKSDMWSTTDGVNWTEEIAISDFNDRGEHDVTVYDNKMWIAAGWRGSLLDDVFYVD